MRLFQFGQVPHKFSFSDLFEPVTQRLFRPYSFNMPKVVKNKPPSKVINEPIISIN
ncbi:MAG: hypothetical protein WAQ98_19000 [Blastocatellia bacterium]